MNTLWGAWHAFLLAFGNDPKAIRDTAIDLDRWITERGIALTWEDVDAVHAFATVQPAGGTKSIRDMSTAHAVVAETSLVFRASEGSRYIEHIEDECLYPFETATGEVFGYSPWINGRNFTIGIGPTSKGKTFTRLVLLSHFLKYGGLVRAIDIDPGAETLAKAFGNDAGILRFGEGRDRGFNPFVNCQGRDDRAFKGHLMRLLRLLLDSNDAEDMRGLTALDQETIDRAIAETLGLPRDAWKLGTLINHLPSSVRRKFTRWVYGDGATHDGMYAQYFDAAEDAIGDMCTPLGVYNLQAMKTLDPVLVPVLYEMFHRTTTYFEDPAVRGVPKLIDIDEARWMLKRDIGAKVIEESYVTGRKFNYGVSLWTQSPTHCLEATGWDGIRTACTSFLFLSDPTMDEDAYRGAFQLTLGECKAIRELEPQKELYIVQREAGISKKLILRAEPGQVVINTSTPAEAIYRDSVIDDLIAEYGTAKALELIYTQLTERRRVPIDRRRAG